MPSARAKRKAKEKDNRRQRAAAGNVLNPYAELDGEEGSEGEDVGEQVEAMEDKSRNDNNANGRDDDRPKTANSDASGETLVGTQDNTTTAPVTTTPTTTNAPSDRPEEEPKLTSAEWTYEPLPTPPDDFGNLEGEDPDEPLTEIEIRQKEIMDWLCEQKGHSYNFKKITRERITGFVYDLKYGAEEGKEERLREMRLMVWRALVRSNFWWKNPETGEYGRPQPISAPTGVYESNFMLFVSCAAERLDRIGRDLPDPEYVQQIEADTRLFFKRVAAASAKVTHFNTGPRSNATGRATTANHALEHLAFLLMIDEEHNRALRQEEFATRLRLCFDKVKGMEWQGLGSVKMGEWPVRKGEPPLRTQDVWEGLVKRFGL